jgi:UDP-glucose 4-epimerase
MSRSACRRVVLASSFTVYDWGAATDVLTEATSLTSDLEGRGGYTRAKIWQERVTRRMADEHGFDLSVVRPGILWGRDDPYPSGISVPVGRLHLLFGIGTSLPLCYVENCADCFAAVTESEAAVGRTFNVVDDAPVPTRRFVAEHLRRTGTAGVPVSVPYGLGLMTVHLASLVSRLAFEGRGRMPSVLIPARYVARFKPLRFSTAQLAEVLGWRPPYDFRTALERTYGHAAGA